MREPDFYVEFVEASSISVVTADILEINFLPLNTKISLINCRFVV